MFNHLEPPIKVQIKSWRVTEANGFVYVWHHADDEEPSWDVIRVTEIDKNEWLYCGRTEHTVICHMQVCVRAIKISKKLATPICVLKFNRRYQRMGQMWLIWERFTKIQSC